MIITLNSAVKDVQGATLAALLVELRLPEERLGVVLNGRVIGRTEMASTVLQEGDRLEITHFVGGGA